MQYRLVYWFYIIQVFNVGNFGIAFSYYYLLNVAVIIVYFYLHHCVYSMCIKFCTQFLLFLSWQLFVTALRIALKSIVWFFLDWFPVILAKRFGKYHKISMGWSQQLCYDKSFEKISKLIDTFSQNAFFSYSFEKWIFCSPNYKISSMWCRELYLWNNLCIIFMSFFDYNPIIIRWKERTFSNIFLKEWRLEWKYYDRTIKRKKQNNCCALVVTLIIMFVNIYQIFLPITLLEHVLTTNQFISKDYCLILWRYFLGGFLYCAYSRQKHFGKYNAENGNFPVLSNEGENCSCKKGLTLGVLIFAGTFFSRILLFLAIFANLNTREIFLDVKFAKIHTHEIFLQLKFAKINTRKKKLSLSGREDKKDNLQNTTYIFPKPNRSQLYNIVCFSF